MKKLFCLFMAIIFLGGCSVLREDTTIPDITLQPKYEPSYANQNIISPSLFYPETSTGNLVAEVRDIETVPGIADEQTIVSALLSPPTSSNLSPLGNDLSLDRVVISGDVANIHLITFEQVDSYNGFLIASAMANTLSNYFGIDYVSLFFNDNVLSIDGKPCGSISKTQNVQTSYQEMVDKLSDKDGFSAFVPLYFFDEDQDLLICEVREIFFEDDNYLRTIITELAAGSKRQENFRTNYRESAVKDMTTTYDEANSAYYAGFQESVFSNVSNFNDMKIEFSSLFMTLKSFVANIDYLLVQTDIQYLLIDYLDCKDMIGDYVTIYLPDLSLSSLTRVNRVVSQSQRGLPQTVVTLLIKGPVPADDGMVLPALPTEVTLDNFITISISGSTATCNFDSEFERMLLKMDEQSMKIGIYALVHSICTLNNINCVYITANSLPINTSSELLDLSYPLLPNPGIVS